MMNPSATGARPTGSLMISPLKQVAACALLWLALLTPCHWAGATGTQLGTPDGLGVFDITATVPTGHGNGFFEMSTDSAFGAAVSTQAGVATVSGAVNGASTLAKFSNPGGVARDSLGNLFVADSGNSAIRMISPNGVVTTIAGSSYGFQDGNGSTALFAFPTGIAVGPSDNNVYVADTYNHRIRKLTRPAVEGEPWIVTTLAGNGTAGFFDASATSARFSSPQGLVVDASGNVYVADSANNRIRKVTSGGVVTTFAGSGTAGFADGASGVAKFNSPYGVVLDSLGNLFVADKVNNRVRKITPGGTVSTYAGMGSQGTADGSALTATFYYPVALAVDSFDNLYVSEEQNHKVRRITSLGDVQSVAGNGTAGFTNARAGAAQFKSPAGLAVNAVGDVLVADSENHCVRRIARDVFVVAVTNTAVTPPVGEIAVKGTISPTALGLGIGTYYFRWRAGDWTIQNDNISKFITTVLPLVTTVAADPVNAADATFNATVNPRTINVTEVKFQYSLDPAFTAPTEVLVTPLPGSGSSDVPVSYTFSYPTNTQPGTVYYFRAVARNDFGTTTADDILSFTVPATTIVTDAATQVTRYAAQLNATVNPKGSSMTVTFNYSTEPTLVDSWVVSTLVASSNASGASGLAVDAGGNAYFSRSELNRIDQTAGALVGTGTPGFVDGPLATASFDHPAGVALYNPNGATKVLYVADRLNHCIRKIDLLAGTVSTFAGSSVAGLVDGPAATARFLYPTGLALDSAGNLYVADTGNHDVRKITVVAGNATTTSTLAGTGVAGLADGAGAGAQFRSPAALTVAADGTIYIADTGNHRICKLTTGNLVSTLAGGGGAGFQDNPDNDSNISAKFSSPDGISIDAAGVLYVADRDNQRIRRIMPDGKVNTLAGSGVAGHLDSPAAGTGLIPATATKFSAPNAVALDATGNVYVTEEGANLDLRKIVPGTIKTVTVTPDVITSGDQAVSASTLVLSPGTTYYYKAIGDNRLDGTIEGSILSFTTFTEPAIQVYDGPSTASPELSQPQLPEVNFGVMARATTTTRTFTIKNNGGWPLAVSAVTAPAGYTIAGGTGSILPGETSTFTVALTTTSIGVFSGDVTLTNDDPFRSSFVFPITGKKVDPPIINSVRLQDLTLLPTSVTMIADVDPNGADTTFEFEVSPGSDFDGVRVTTVAGETTGYNDAKGVAAQFNKPQGLVADANGNIFVADTLNHRIRKISPTGVVTTLAGTGDAGYLDGSSAVAQFDQPTGIALASDGTLYIADSNNRRIRAYSPATDQVTTFSGTGVGGFTDGVVAGARFASPLGLAIDSAGILYVADRDNHRVRKVALDGSVSTLANLGPTSAPTAVAVASDGTVYVADAGDHLIRRVTAAGVVTTLAGSGVAGSANGVGVLASFDTPVGIAFDEVAGRVYVADQSVHRVRKILLDGTVSTLAGSGTQGVTDGLGSDAQFDTPLSVALLTTKTVVVGELGGSTIRQITPTVIKVPAASAVTSAGEVTLDIGGLDPGIIYYFRAIAISVGGRVVSDAPLIGSAFTQWQIDNFGRDAVNPLIAGPAATPANDHVPNLLKYALGLDPHVRAISGLPVLRFDHPSAGFFSLTINRNPAATNIRYFYESSTDSVHWSTDNIQLSGDSIGYLPYKDVPRRFLRLGVELVLP